MNTSPAMIWPANTHRFAIHDSQELFVVINVAIATLSPRRTRDVRPSQSSPPVTPIKPWSATCRKS